VVQCPKPHTTSATIVTSTKGTEHRKKGQEGGGKEAHNFMGGMHKCSREATKMANGMRAGPRAIH